MIEGFAIDPSTVYDDSALQLGLGLSSEALAGARKSGALRYTRQGKRILYLGRWILDWLDTDKESTEK